MAIVKYRKVTLEIHIRLKFAGILIALEFIAVSFENILAYDNGSGSLRVVIQTFLHVQREIAIEGNIWVFSVFVGRYSL